MHFVEVKGILSAQNGMNLYRGCTHGCIYCDARSKCYQFTHEFEDIEVKSNAVVLLEKALRSKRNKCMIGTGAMSDPYIHCETTLGQTRKCLELIRDYEYGLAIQTKSSRILRDLDLLVEIHRNAKCVVQMTMTTYDEELCKIVEPNVSTTKERFETLKVLRDHNIPTVVWLSPILPYLNDTPENIKGIMEYCIEAGVYGVLCFGMGLTLREGDREYYYQKLDEHFPGMKERYIRRYGNAYELPSDHDQELMTLFRSICTEHQIEHNVGKLFEYMHEYPDQDNQLSIFDLM